MRQITDQPRRLSSEGALAEPLLLRSASVSPLREEREHSVENSCSLSRNKSLRVDSLEYLQSNELILFLTLMQIELPYERRILNNETKD
jgi:hypothetical protein